MNNAAEYVAAKLVNTERVRETHAGERRSSAHLRISIMRPERSGDGDDQMDKQYEAAYAEAERHLPPQ
jgi:hypothetical protein